jgi:VCBS repeat-containing protein
VDGKVAFNPGSDFDHLAVGEQANVVVSYTIADEHGEGSSSTVTITVTGTNDGPVAVADTAEGEENETLAIDVLANDTDLDDGAVLTLVSASAPAGKGSASVQGSQVLFDPGSDFDHLAAGATEQVQVSYTIQDEHGATSSSTVTITVTGTNDGPVANADTAAGHENQTLTINVRANDTDVDDGAVLTLVSASAPAGKGSASIDGNQLVFNPGTDFDHLAAGATEQVVVTYTIKDEHNASSTSTVTITVTGTNDGPVANADTGAGHENQTLTLDVLANDTDVDQGAVLTLVSASAPAGQGAAAVVDGKVVFTPGADFDDLAEGATEQVVVSYTIQDEHGAQSSSTVTITVTGTNDGPVIDAANTTASAQVTELVDGATGENATTHTKTGTIAFSDVDLTDTHSVLGVVPQGSGYLGTLTLGTIDQAGDTVGWSFAVADGALDGLAAGQVLTQTYTVTLGDGHGGTVAQEVTVTLTGTNDAPAINAAGTTGSAQVTEIADGAAGENAATHTKTGTIAFSDVDLTDTHSVLGVVPQGSGYLGSLTLGAVDQAGDKVGWSFSVSDSALDGLQAGQVLTQTYTVTVSDGKGGTATQDVTVTISGTNDAPVITSNGGGATASVTVSESSSAVTTVTATDLDSSSITYSIIGGDDAGKFTINSVTGALSFIAAPNYESPTDSDQNNSYVVQVRASDGAAADLQTITVNVSDVAEGDIQGPTGVKFNFNFASIDKLETGADLPGGVPLGSFVAVGDPNSTSFTYQIVDTDPSHIISNFFSLSATGALSTTASGVPSGTYTFDIVAVDQAGNASPATPITVWVGTTNDDGTGTAPVVLSAGTDLGFGLNGGDVINGGGGDDVILGGQNTDKIDGGSGNDLLLGGANTDTLLGNVGNDTILGSAGEDTINGGAGTDTLTGNGGDDVFVFQQGEAAGDRVTDFEGATAAKGDTLRFEGYGAGATLTYLSGDDWKITFSGGTEVIKLTGITALNSGDYIFV